LPEPALDHGDPILQPLAPRSLAGDRVVFLVPLDGEIVEQLDPRLVQNLVVEPAGHSLVLLGAHRLPSPSCVDTAILPGLRAEHHDASTVLTHRLPETVTPRPAGRLPAHALDREWHRTTTTSPHCSGISERRPA